MPLDGRLLTFRVVDLSTKRIKQEMIDNFSIIKSEKGRHNRDVYVITFDEKDQSYESDCVVRLTPEMYADMQRQIIYLLPMAIIIYPSRYLKMVTSPRTPLHLIEKCDVSVDHVPPSVWLTAMKSLLK